MTAMFSKPKIPNLTTPSPQPPKNPQLEAELATLGRRQGMLATLFSGAGGAGSAQARGPTKAAKLTGGGQ